MQVFQKVLRVSAVKRTVLGLILPLFATAVSHAAASSPPDWVSSLTPGTWSAISQNTMSNVDPEQDPALNPNFPNNAPWHANSGQKSVLIAWNGGALATEYGSHGALLTYGGGHSSYYGSEVYAFDLASRLWKRVTNPYTGPISFPYPTTAYPDGSPIPMHTYDYGDYHPGTNSFVLMRGNKDSARSSNDTSEAIVHLLDLGTGQWRRSQRNGSLGIHSGGISCYDRIRDSFWVLGASTTTNQLTRFDPNVTNSDGTVGKFANYAPPRIEIDGAAECDPVNDLFVYTQFRNAGVVYAVNLKDPTAPRVALKETGDIPAKSGGNGWAWSDKRQAFIYWRRGGGVYEFKLVEGNWSTGTWRWTNLTAASNAVVPQDMTPDNGVYSRFRIARWGDEEVGVVVNRSDGPVYAFRIPSGSQSATPISVSITASPRSIEAGQQSTLAWSSSGAASCTALGGWTGVRETAGSATVGPLAVTTLFELECRNSSGSVGRGSVQVSVGAAVPTNTAPVIQGTPGSSVVVGNTYSFVPFASDPEGSYLAFSIQNKPAWATFNAATGALTGVPTAGDVGTTAGIVISVSDGNESRSLQAFSVEVVAQGGYGGTLTWQPPSIDGDGNDLRDLAGYTIYYGGESRAYTQSIEIPNPGVTSYYIDGLAAGTYYFAVSSYDFSGNESQPSGEVRAVLAVPADDGSTDGGTSGGTTDPSTDGGTGGGTTDPGTDGGTGGGTTDPGTDGGTGGGLPEAPATPGSPDSGGGIGGFGALELALLLLLAGLEITRRSGVIKMNRVTGYLAGVVVALAMAISGQAWADDADFQRRCAAPGVLKCVGFDSSAEAAPGGNLYKAGDGQFHGSIDSSVKASGNGSLRFDSLPGSGPNSAGFWLADLGGAFGEGSHFYVQWRQRFSRSMVENKFGGGGWKQIILHRDGPSCANVQVVLLNNFYRGLPQGYSHCGAAGYAARIHLPDGDDLLQQGDYQCLRRSINAADCAMYVADEWMTFYLDIQVGTFGQPNSRLNFHVGYEGQPMKKFIEINNYQFEYDVGHGDTFRKVQLTPYDTGRDESLSHPAAYTWYDELIVSTQPIAGPNGAVPPAPIVDAVAPAPPGALQFQF